MLISVRAGSDVLTEGTLLPDNENKPRREAPDEEEECTEEEESSTPSFTLALSRSLALLVAMEATGNNGKSAAAVSIPLLTCSKDKKPD